MFTRSRPAAFSASAKRGSKTPLVVSEMSVISGMARINAHQVGQPLPHQRLAAGDPDLGDAQLHRRPHEELHVFVGEHVLVRLEGHALRGHAIDAAVVAPIGDGKTQVVDALPCWRIHVPASSRIV